MVTRSRLKKAGKPSSKSIIGGFGNSLTSVLNESSKVAGFKKKK